MNDKRTLSWNDLYYKLDGKVPVPCSLQEAFSVEQREKKQIAQDEINGVKVSTVFLSINHGWGEGPPILFETMIFGGEHDEYQERYCTYEEAEQGHKKALELIK